MSDDNYLHAAINHLTAAMESDDRTQKLKEAIARLRRVASSQPDVMAICDALERHFGSPEAHRAKLHPAWKGRIPPEPGEG